MPKRASMTAHHSVRLQRCAHGTGFTLIEMLVVLLIVGIMTAIAGLSFGSGGVADKVKTEARRARDLIQLASDTAVLQSTQIGLIVSDHKYRFVTFRSGHWQPFADSDPLRPRTLAAPLEVHASSDHRPVPEAVRQLYGGDDMPAILILSSGGMTPFQLTLKADGTDAAYRIQGRWDGQITLQPQRSNHG